MPHTRKLSRREALKGLSATALLGLGLWPGCHSPRAKSGGTFQFIAANDLHHLSAECDPWFDALIRQLRTHDKAELALLLGDLTEKGEQENLGAIRDHFRGLRKPIYTQIGNHDYTTATDRSAYVKLFPNQINYAFRHRGWQFVSIDSTQGTAYTKTRIQPETLRWLDENLPKLDPHKPTVLYTHFPLASSVQMAPLNAPEVLERFRPFNLRGCFSGHFHGYTRNQFAEADVLTNRCCARSRDNHDGTSEKGYWLVTAAGQTLTLEFIQFDGMKS